MQPEIIQSMHERVRAIYRALTGEDVVESDVIRDDASYTDENITRRFAELEEIARAFPSVAERVAPFTFTPPVDVIAGDDAVIVEVALPGVDRDAITIERLSDSALAISGIRRIPEGASGLLFHAELPRGPFYRTIPLPFPLEAEPRIELDRGVLRIYLALATSRASVGNSISDQTDEHRRNGDEDGR